MGFFSKKKEKEIKPVPADIDMKETEFHPVLADGSKFTSIEFHGKARFRTFTSRTKAKQFIKSHRPWNITAINTEGWTPAVTA